MGSVNFFKLLFVAMTAALYSYSVQASPYQLCGKVYSHKSMRVYRPRWLPGPSLRSEVESYAVRADKRIVENSAREIIGDSRLVTVKELHAAGFIISPELLSILGIPKTFHEYYDKKTGDFSYKKSGEPYRLSVENGDAPMRFLRLHVESDPVEARVLADVKFFLERQPDLFVVITYSSWFVALSRWFETLGERHQDRVVLIESPMARREGVWAQDFSKPLEAPFQTLFPAKKYRGQRQTGVHQSIKEDYGLVDLKYSKFIFEGGDIIVGDRHIFVGASVVRANMDMLRVSEKEVLAALSSEFGKTVVPIGFYRRTGELAAIDFHADLIMSVFRNHKNGDEQIVLTSPVKLLEVVTGEKVARHSAQEILSLREYAIEKLDSTVRTESTEALLILLERMSAQELILYSARLENVKSDLENLGYRVLELPGLGRTRELNKDDLRVFNYTNVIFDGAVVYLPHFGIKQLDHFSEKFFVNAGYDVVPARSAPFTFMERGGIRCRCEVFRYSDQGSR